MGALLKSPVVSEWGKDVKVVNAPIGSWPKESNDDASAFQEQYRSKSLIFLGFFV